MKVTRRGQVTIPKRIRERLRIEEGSEIEFTVEGARVVIRKKGRANPFRSWLGFLKRPGKSDALVRGMRGHTG